MDKNSDRKVFHPDYPLEITNLTESEIAEAVLNYCKCKNLPAPSIETYKPKKAAKHKKAKREKKSTSGCDY